LQCLLELTTRDEIGQLPLLVGPGALAALLASRRGLIYCGMSRNPRARMAINERPKTCKKVKIGSAEEDIKQAGKGNASLTIGETSIEVLRCEDTYMAIAALASSTYLDSNCMIFLADKECLDCCISKVIAVNRPEKTHFGIFRLQG